MSRSEGRFGRESVLRRGSLSCVGEYCCGLGGGAGVVVLEAAAVAAAGEDSGFACGDLCWADVDIDAGVVGDVADGASLILTSSPAASEFSFLIGVSGLREGPACFSEPDRFGGGCATVFFCAAVDSLVVDFLFESVRPPEGCPCG